MLIYSFGVLVVRKSYREYTLFIITNHPQGTDWVTVTRAKFERSVIRREVGDGGPDPGGGETHCKSQLTFNRHSWHSGLNHPQVAFTSLTYSQVIFLCLDGLFVWRGSL